MRYQLNDEDYSWIQAREIYFRGNNKWSKQEMLHSFEIWERVFGKPKKFTGCGRCAMNVRQDLWRIYLLQRDNPNIITE